ncbi:hypothetical protein JR334_11780 [Clostridia bacterium]|nr:hypothetical protein JR334_11780 [Clostridia bacterium]
MKKVLLMTLSTGGGHNYAANSLEKKLKELGFETAVSDPFKEQDKLLDVLVSDGYKRLAKTTPQLYGQVYRVADKNRLNEAAINIIKKKSEKGILQIIENQVPDIIISTHPILTFILGALKESGKIDLPLISVVTDFEGHHTYTAKHRFIDAYITGSQHTKKDLMLRGVPENKVFPYGIPIRQEFYEPRPEKNPDDLFTILLMGGSMGLKLMEKVLARIVAMPVIMRIIVVCGNDEALHKRLLKKYGEGLSEKEIVIHGFYTDIAGLMDQADLLISKPGGLSVSEAIAKKMPMLIPYLIPGQEEDNADFLDAEGAAIKVEDISHIPSIIMLMLEQPYILKTMQKNMESIADTHSLSAIMEITQNLSQQKTSKNEKRLPVLIFYNGLFSSNADAAVALENQMSRNGMDVLSMDLFQHVAPRLHRGIYLSLSNLAGHLTIQESVLRGTRFRSENVEDLFSRIFFPMFRRVIRQKKPSVIISLYPELAILSSSYKQHYGGKYKLILAVTEMPKNRSWLVRGVDAYIAADSVIEQRLIDLGVDRLKLRKANLPFERTKEEHPPALFNEHMPTLVLFGDYLERLEQPKKFYDWLNDSGWQTIMVTGGKRSLSRSIGKGYTNIHELREVESIQEILGHADLLVAKPLYITAYEALLNWTPFVAFTKKKQPMLEIVQKTAMQVSNTDELKSILKTFIASSEMRKECMERIEGVRKEYEQDSTYVKVAIELLKKVEDGNTAG